MCFWPTNFALTFQPTAIPNELSTKRPAYVVKPPSSGSKVAISIRQFEAANTTIDHMITPMRSPAGPAETRGLPTEMNRVVPIDPAMAINWTCRILRPLSVNIFCAPRNPIQELTGGGRWQVAESSLDAQRPRRSAQPRQWVPPLRHRLSCSQTCCDAFRGQRIKVLSDDLLLPSCYTERDRRLHMGVRI
jgi:hypothetical protein